MTTSIVSHRLRTALQVASAKAGAIKHEARAAQWAARLDPAAYACHRDGDAWIAAGPAGQRFEFRRGIVWSEGHRDVDVASHTGGEYVIQMHHDLCACSCEAAARAGTCKHIVAWLAVRRTASGERAAAALELRAEAAEMARAA